MLGISGEFQGQLLLKTIKLIFIAWVASGTIRAQGWSITELHYQGGSVLRPHPVSPDGFQQILTLQHASGWRYGENFFFADMECFTRSGASRDVYLEWSPYLSLGAITGRNISWGLIRGIGPLGGLNWGKRSKVLKIAPGLRFQLDLPGFAFANVDYLYLVDRSQGLAAGGAPKESNNHLIDFNWGLPFKIGEEEFSLEGHGEWRSPRDTEFGARAPYSILLQPQLRFDFGKRLAKQPGRLFVGIEFQVWINKFGFEDADEVLPQFLVVFRF